MIPAPSHDGTHPQTATQIMCVITQWPSVEWLTERFPGRDKNTGAETYSMIWAGYEGSFDTILNAIDDKVFTTMYVACKAGPAGGSPLSRDCPPSRPLRRLPQAPQPPPRGSPWRAAPCRAGSRMPAAAIGSAVMARLGAFDSLCLDTPYDSEYPG